MKATDQHCLVDVLGVQIAPLDMERVVTKLDCALREHMKGYVCLAGVHGIMEAQRNVDVRAAYAASLLTVPDGMPTVWVGRFQGHSLMERVTGPDLMIELMHRKAFVGRTHFLYGGKEGVAKELKEELERRFPLINIVGIYTPPFRDLLPDEEKSFIDLIAELKPDIIWVGVSTPRQERFMHRMSPRLQTTLMFGVGAAFDFHTGRIKDCAEWIKQAGLQWFDRLLQDPRHLWKRYLLNNPVFIYRILLQLIRDARRPMHAVTSQRVSPALHKMDSTL